MRLLATTDLHAHLMPWDYMADAPSPVGLAQIAPLIRMARDAATNCLLLDNGDFLQGSPLGDWQDRFGTAPHPMVAAMNALGYDAGTLGNHEFSHGLRFLQAALGDARFPVVSANLSRSDGVPLVAPFALLDRTVTDTTGRSHALRIGITGFAPPQTTLWEKLRLHGRVSATDILTAADTVLAQLSDHGPDLTIALAHSGIDTGRARPDMENAALPLAAHPAIDVVIAGHTHLVFPDCTSPRTDQTLNGKPAVMAGFHGSHLGQIDLVLRQGADGWRVISHRSQAIAAPATACADAELARLAEPAHRATAAYMRQPLGHSSRTLHTHFALIAPSATLALIGDAQCAYWRHRLPAALGHLPLLAAVAPFRTGGRGGPRNVTDIAAGPIEVRHIADLYTHPNTPVLLHLSGAEIADWLERAVILFRQIPQGAQDAPLLSPDIPGFDFDIVGGLSFRIDLTQPPRFDPRGHLLNPQARRIRDLARNGQPLRPDAGVLLATNSYRAGSGIYAGTSRDPVARSDLAIRDILADHIATCGAIGGKGGETGPPAWGFCPMPDTTVWLDVSPDAARHSADIAHFRPEPLGLTDAGFLRFRLSL